MKLILKGILLYSTVILTILYMLSIDSIVNYLIIFIHSTILLIVLLILCYIFIDEESMYKLTFNNKDNIDNKV